MLTHSLPDLREWAERDCEDYRFLRPRLGLLTESPPLFGLLIVLFFCLFWVGLRIEPLIDFMSSFCLFAIVLVFGVNCLRALLGVVMRPSESFSLTRISLL